jgi:hypothetical protein
MDILIKIFNLPLIFSKTLMRRKLKFLTKQFFLGYLFLIGIGTLIFIPGRLWSLDLGFYVELGYSNVSMIKYEQVATSLSKKQFVTHGPLLDVGILTRINFWNINAGLAVPVYMVVTHESNTPDGDWEWASDSDIQNLYKPYKKDSLGFHLTNNMNLLLRPYVGTGFDIGVPYFPLIFIPEYRFYYLEIMTDQKFGFHSVGAALEIEGLEKVNLKFGFEIPLGQDDYQSSKKSGVYIQDGFNIKASFSARYGYEK